MCKKIRIRHDLSLKSLLTTLYQSTSFIIQFDLLKESPSETIALPSARIFDPLKNERFT